MPLIYATPPAVDVVFRPGTTIVGTLTWSVPGSLSGRTFTSTLGGDALALVVEGDVMTITVPNEITALHTDSSVGWLLSEDIGGDDEPIIIGRWAPSYQPSATSQNFDVTVTDGDIEVTVSVVTLGGAALTAHAALPSGAVHGLIEHHWADEDWTPFTEVVISAHGSQTFDATVDDGKGVVSGAGPDGNLRVAYLRDGTDWADGEVVSVIWGPTAAWSGNNAQQGHLHRVREISPGLWEGIACWTNVFGLVGYRFMHVNTVRFDGTTLLQGPGAPTGFGETDAGAIDRRVQTTGRERIAPFGLQRAVVQPLQTHYLRHVVIGDTVTSSGFDDTSFNETDAPVQEYTAQDQLTFDSTGATTPWASVRRGLVEPTSREKRWVPFVLATRVVGGDAATVPVEMKRWRLGDPEPDWGDPRVQRSTIATGVDVPTIPLGPGLHGLWGAHFFDGSGGAWGDVRFRRL